MLETDDNLSSPRRGDSPSSNAPAVEVVACYQDRLAARKRAEGDLRRRHETIGNAKLGLAAAVLIGAGAALLAHLFSAWWIGVPVATYLLLARRHTAVLSDLDRSKRAVEFYERALRRVRDTWQGDGSDGASYLPRNHPYAQDLDLFGPASLFQLLSQARTQAGEICLAHWLSVPADITTIRARQEAVEELRDRLDLREDLYVIGGQVRADLEPGSMLTWAEMEAVPNLARLRALTLGIAIANVVLLIAGFFGLGYLPVILTGLFGILLRRRYRHAISKIAIEVQRPAKSLALFTRLLERLETEKFESSLLKDIAARMDLPRKPSKLVAHLEGLCELLEFRRSDLFAPFDALLLWVFQVSLAIEKWRTHYGSHLSRWLQAMGELEALLSLSAYRYEHPADCLPELVEGETVFAGANMGHPLIPAINVVRNDASLTSDQRVLIVSGSNMSGKSTYLRTIGINAVLALAGAPVRAESLRISVLQIGASIRTTDSLYGGVSRFYAELLRIQQIMGLASGPHPVLFLLDEILHGTNSHDRLIGAEAIVRGLAARGAIGLVTTHDLAIARVTEDTDLRAVNVHFQDDLQDGKLSFDYRMRPGVVQRSNALELMRSVGLDV
jgi:hypothetical protein